MGGKNSPTSPTLPGLYSTNLGLVSTESVRSLLASLVPALSSLSTPSAGSPSMKWRSSRGSRWRRTCARPARSSRARWRMPSMSTRPVYSDRVSVVVMLSELLFIFSSVFWNHIKTLGFMSFQICWGDRRNFDAWRRYTVRRCRRGRRCSSGIC